MKQNEEYTHITASKPLALLFVITLHNAFLFSFNNKNKLLFTESASNINLKEIPILHD